jgi:hypothetical protein
MLMMQISSHTSCVYYCPVLWRVSARFHFLHICCRNTQFAYKLVPFVLHSHITENGMIGDEAVAAYFNVLSLHMGGGAEENH